MEALTQTTEAETVEAGADAAAEAAGSETAKTRAERRKARRERQMEANKITFILQGDVRKFLATQARAAGMEIGHYMQRLVENHILETAEGDNPLAQRIAARRAVIDYVVSLAQKMVAAGEFDDHFILKVMQRAAADKDFVDLYEVAVSEPSDNPRRASRARVSLNQQLGRLIKSAAQARSKRDENRRIQRAQVEGALITSYTLLERKPA